MTSVRATRCLRSSQPAPRSATPTTPVDTDWVAPTITLTRPNRSLYTLNEPLTAAFSCTEQGSSGLATCVGTQANGATIPTSSAGHFTFTVTTTDSIGNHRSISFAYDVTAGDVTTTVPPGPASVSTDPGSVGASAAVPVQTSIAFTAPAGPADAGHDRHARAEHRGAERLRDPRQRGRHRPWRRDTAGPRPDRHHLRRRFEHRRRSRPRSPSPARMPMSTTDVALPCDALPAASPDPCYTAAFVAGAGSDVRVTVRTTHASKWLVLKRKDTSPPTVTSTVTGTLGSNNWYRSNVAIGWTVTDAQSAILTSTGLRTVDGHDGHGRLDGDLQGHECRWDHDEVRHGQARRHRANADLPDGIIRPRRRHGQGQGDGHRRRVRSGRVECHRRRRTRQASGSKSVNRDRQGQGRQRRPPSAAPTR